MKAKDFLILFAIIMVAPIVIVIDFSIEVALIMFD